jgi:hypothetical protein
MIEACPIASWAEDDSSMTCASAPKILTQSHGQNELGIAPLMASIVAQSLDHTFID